MNITYTASRIAGYVLFPPSITLTDQGITIKAPSLFNQQRRMIPYHAIGFVDIYNPIVGFSSITISAYGEDITLNGFLSAEVEHMKRIIEQGGPSSW